MTPQEIYDKKFEKAVGGYKIEDVNRFVTDMGIQTEKYDAEIEDLQEKLYTLAEKLEEYRADEESLRAAIVGAQKLGSSIVRESKQKAEIVIAEAMQKAEAILIEAKKKSEGALDEIKRSMAAETYTMERIKAESTKFRRTLLSMYEQQIALINAIPHEEGADKKFPEPPAGVAVPDDTPPEESKLEFTIVDEPEEIIEAAGEQPESDERPKRRFGTLMFGEEFDLIRKE